MSLRYYMDHNVHDAITVGLRARGIDCLTAFEDGAMRTPDRELLMRASELACVLFTMDEDFFAIADRCFASGQTFAGSSMLRSFTLPLATRSTTSI